MLTFGFLEKILCNLKARIAMKYFLVISAKVWSVIMPDIEYFKS